MRQNQIKQNSFRYNSRSPVRRGYHKKMARSQSKKRDFYRMDQITQSLTNLSRQVNKIEEITQPLQQQQDARENQFKVENIFIENKIQRPINAYDNNATQKQWLQNNLHVPGKQRPQSASTRVNQQMSVMPSDNSLGNLRVPSNQIIDIQNNQGSPSQISKFSRGESSSNMVNNLFAQTKTSSISKSAKKTIIDFELLKDMNAKAQVFLFSKDLVKALKLLKGCEKMCSQKIENDQDHIKILKYQTFLLLGDTYFQMRNHFQSIQYYKTALDIVQQLHSLQQKEDIEKKYVIWDSVNYPNEPQLWTERHISQVLYKMATVILYLKNRNEALIYSAQANIWAKKCINDLKETITYKFNNETKGQFNNLCQTYFDMVQFYAQTLKTTGDVFQKLQQFDQAKSKYTLAKQILHGNFLFLGEMAATNNQQQGIFNEARRFVRDHLKNAETTNLTEIQRLSNNLTQQQNANKLKDMYEQNQNPLFSSMKSQNSQGFLEIQAYISRDVTNIFQNSKLPINEQIESLSMKVTDPKYQSVSQMSGMGYDLLNDKRAHSNYRAHVNRLSKKSFTGEVVKFSKNKRPEFIMVEKCPEVESALSNLKQVIKKKKNKPSFINQAKEDRYSQSYGQHMSMRDSQSYKSLNTSNPVQPFQFQQPPPLEENNFVVPTQQQESLFDRQEALDSARNIEINKQYYRTNQEDDVIHETLQKIETIINEASPEKKQTLQASYMVAQQQVVQMTQITEQPRAEQSPSRAEGAASSQLEDTVNHFIETKTKTDEKMNEQLQKIESLQNQLQSSKDNLIVNQQQVAASIVEMDRHLKSIKEDKEIQVNENKQIVEKFKQFQVNSEEGDKNYKQLAKSMEQIQENQKKQEQEYTQKLTYLEKQLEKHIQLQQQQSEEQKQHDSFQVDQLFDQVKQVLSLQEQMVKDPHRQPSPINASTSQVQPPPEVKSASVQAEIEQPQKDQQYTINSNEVSHIQIDIEKPPEDNSNIIKQQQEKEKIMTVRSKYQILEEEQLMNIIISIQRQPEQIKSYKKDVIKKKYKFQVNTANLVSSTKEFITKFEQGAQRQTEKLQLEETPFQNHVDCIKKIIEQLVKDELIKLRDQQNQSKTISIVYEEPVEPKQDKQQMQKQEIGISKIQNAPPEIGIPTIHSDDYYEKEEQVESNDKALFDNSYIPQKQTVEKEYKSAPQVKKSIASSRVGSEQINQISAEQYTDNLINAVQTHDMQDQEEASIEGKEIEVPDHQMHTFSEQPLSQDKHVIQTSEEIKREPEQIKESKPPRPPNRSAKKEENAMPLQQLLEKNPDQLMQQDEGKYANVRASLKSKEDRQAFRAAYLDNLRKRPPSAKSNNQYYIKSREQTLEGISDSRSQNKSRREILSRKDSQIDDSIQDVISETEPAKPVIDSIKEPPKRQKDPLPTKTKLSQSFNKGNDYQYQDRKVYPDKSVYRGQYVMIDVERNGKTMKAEARQGYGVRQFDDGSEYEGNWHENMPNGQGIFKFTNGDIYKGAFFNGMSHGKGELTKANRDVYKGDFKENQPSGHGLYFYSDGSMYAGEFQQGMKHGSGAQKFKNGDNYRGYWSHNQIDGYGQFNWVDGRSLIGDWSEGKCHGKGQYKWPDGREFDGKFESDKKMGEGKMKYPDKRILEGVWEDDKLNGTCLVKYPNGKQESQIWKNDEMISMDIIAVGNNSQNQ